MSVGETPYLSLRIRCWVSTRAVFVTSTECWRPCAGLPCTAAQVSHLTVLMWIVTPGPCDFVLCEVWNWGLAQVLALPSYASECWCYSSCRSAQNLLRVSPHPLPRVKLIAAFFIVTGCKCPWSFSFPVSLSLCNWAWKSSHREAESVFHPLMVWALWPALAHGTRDPKEAWKVLQLWNACIVQLLGSQGWPRECAWASLLVGEQLTDQLPLLPCGQPARCGTREWGQPMARTHLNPDISGAETDLLVESCSHGPLTGWWTNDWLLF